MFLVSPTNHKQPIMDSLETTRICRACFALITDGNFTEIDGNPIKPDLKELLFIYVPEFEIKVEQPCLCFNCFSTLYLFHKFKRRCLRSEEDLRLYIRERPHCATANLKDVLKCGYARDQDVELHPSQQKGKTMQRPRKTTSAVENQQEDSFDDSLEIYKCGLCSTTCLNTETELRRHLKFVHNRKYETTCIICYAEFSSKLTLRQHMDSHTNEKGAAVLQGDLKRDGAIKKCIICLEKFASESVLREHLFNVHNKNRYTTCMLCLKEMRTKKTLRDHMLVHTGIKRFKCMLCSSSFLKSSRLQSHIQVIHKGVKFGQGCPHCGRRFIEPRYFQKHLDMHKDPEKTKYVCEKCNCVYSTILALRMHLRKHYNQTIISNSLA